MIGLAELLKDMVSDPPPVVVRGITDDSRHVSAGDAFVAVAGDASDGHAFAPDAAAAGAAVVLSERPISGLQVPVVVVPALKRLRGELAARLLGRPSSELRCVGVTGTNGKTSIACFIAELAAMLGHRAGYMGTIGWGEAGALARSSLTTASAIDTQARLADFRDRGLSWAVLEASSHALDQHRLDAVAFDYAVFSNLSRDHLDYHGDFESYGAAKARLFEMPGLTAAVINVDDPFGRSLVDRPGDDVAVITCGTEGDVRWTDLRFEAAGISGTFHTPWGRSAFHLPLYGAFSVSNTAAALAVLCHAGETLERVIEGLGRLSPVPGRMEFFPGQPTIVVDYAHTPDALEKMLDGLAPHAAGRLIAVVGCGGDRDRGKRPQMAAAACEHADEVWFTSDNPRSEAPDAILDDMMPGVPSGRRVMREVDRERAIRQAVAAAEPEDLIVIAGKGHEDYQEIRGERLPFSDRDLAAALTGAPSPTTGPVEAPCCSG
jgi:UDP-N-acetylmuramoyl-L-alanyl-D-glutamate--2,6-diaminopimelate ligase